MATRKPRTDLTAEQVRKALDYDPETGVFTWKHREDVPPKTNTKFAGKTAGTACRIRSSRRNHWYRYIKILGRRYAAHRLAWLYVTGEWPKEQVDHVNGNGLDNRIANLRPATQSQNSSNSRLSHRNKTGFKGVRFRARTGRFEAYIGTGGKARHLGTFPTAEEAHEAYLKAAREQWGDFARSE